MEIVLIRHTTPNIEKGICYGRSNIDVAHTFVEEIKPILNLVSTQKFDAIYSSPLLRCKRLAELISNNVIFDNRLMELNFGDWELQPWNQIPKEELNAWMDNFVNATTKNGESYLDLHERATDFILDIFERKYQKVLIVTHAGVMRSLWAFWNKIPLEKSFDLEIKYGEVLIINTERKKTI